RISWVKVSVFNVIILILMVNLFRKTYFTIEPFNFQLSLVTPKSNDALLGQKIIYEAENVVMVEDHLTTQIFYLPSMPIL
ncbi:hypothetical protein QUF63_08315, partial [Anaerolineales bacterium HSG25]|nr:hypothetical protein [Anaerolineales bacterium HSG25]